MSGEPDPTALLLTWGHTVNVSSTRGSQQTRFGRFLLTGALVLAPITLIPIALAGSASASETTSVQTIGAAQTVTADSTVAGADCRASHWNVTAPTISAAGTATVTVVPQDCMGAQLTLAAYSTDGGDWATAGAQTRAGVQTKTVTGPTTFTVAVPPCYYQLDLITGVDTPSTLPAGESYFSDHDTLLAHYNGGTACVLPSSTSTTPTTSSTPPTSVEATSTSRSTQAVVPSTSSTPPASLPTEVKGESFTKAASPTVAATAATLPFTGTKLPIGPTVLLALELIVAGAAIMLIMYGRRRAQGTHR